METETGLCYGPGSIAGAVIGTLFTTIFLLIVAALLYRKWRRQKGKHLVLVTDPEIVEDAYAFDNPCFKDATPVQNKTMERPLSVAIVETPIKDTTKWTTPWSGLGIVTSNKRGKRRTLDDSCLGPKATRVSVVSLRSRDFTGLGFNVCGNMREGIFVKDLLHRGPASESGRIHPGDRIASVKISFRSMVYEDALTILSYASPYDVELEVESGGSGSRPTTLLKKSVGPSPTRICHPFYRSQSIPELSHVNKNSAKRLFIADPNESIGSNYSTMNSTIKSSQSTPGNHTLERRHEESKTNNHHKFGIKVLPALDGTVHRIEHQNEHNTNLERKHSRKIDVEKNSLNQTDNIVLSAPVAPERINERLHQHENPFDKIGNGVDLTDGKKFIDKYEEIVIPSEVPAEVHNAAMAARRNRKNSAELLSPFKPVDNDADDKKSPQKNKRKAPAPPVSPTKDNETKRDELDDGIDTIADYTESLNDYVEKVREATTESTEVRTLRSEERLSDRRNSESDTDSELQHSFTTIELNPSDITIHHTPVPRVNDDDDDDDDDEADDVYRKAASLGDLSKYEAKSSATLERAQSLDMADAGSKKRKAPLPPPEDIAEFNEDLTKLDDIGTFDHRKLKKSSEWGTLEDAVWKQSTVSEEMTKPKARKKSSGTLERSKSAVEFKLKDDKSNDCSVELYNLPLSKSLTRDFIHAERMFNPDEDNSLSRIINNGEIIKSPKFEEIELDFRQAIPLPDSPEIIDESSNVESFDKALRYFDLHTRLPSKKITEIDLGIINGDNDIYDGMEEAKEELVKKITINRTCPDCELGGKHDKKCEIHGSRNIRDSDESLKLSLTIEPKLVEDIEKQIEKDDIICDEEIDDGCDIGLGVTVNSKRLSPDRHNISNISVSSGENSEDSGLVGESGEFSTDTRPPLPNTPAPHQDTSRKLTYITEIEVSPRDNTKKPKANEIHAKPPRGQVTVTSNGKPLPGKKPPVPPRRSDARAVKDTTEKQVVYVSEYEAPEKNTTDADDKVEQTDKKFEHWIYLGENKEQNSWDNGGQPQPVTNIVVSSSNENIIK